MSTLEGICPVCAEVAREAGLDEQAINAVNLDTILSEHLFAACVVSRACMSRCRMPAIS